ncbi:hypothetical protein [Embleya sp. NPDC005971]|uniref:hypothetical protein n=1 Tax=Embleya sp. NPDC005971 TaxID=3156724 RepID=UPI00340E640B
MTRLPEKLVDLAVHRDVVVEALTCLKLLDAVVVDARVEADETVRMCLRMRNVPEGAEVLSPYFTVTWPSFDLTDPSPGEVRLAGVTWYRADGTQLTTIER